MVVLLCDKSFVSLGESLYRVPRYSVLTEPLMWDVMAQKLQLNSSFMLSGMFLILCRLNL